MEIMQLRQTLSMKNGEGQQMVLKVRELEELLG